MCVFSRFLLPVLAALTLTFPASAEIADTARPRFEVALGHTTLSANEQVYWNGDRISRLNWEAKVPTATLGFSNRFADGWILNGQATFRLGGNGHMTDHDWLPPFATGFGPDDWSHQSTHPDSPLRKYLDVDLSLGRDIVLNDSTRLNLHGGVKYTNVRWDARGGTSVYSYQDLRDTAGLFRDGMRVVSYKQEHVTIFGGAELTRVQGPWQFSGRLRAGISPSPQERDHHWLRDLRFDNDYGAMAYASIAGQVDYQIADRFTVFASAGYQKFFEDRGDAYYTTIEHGQDLGYAPGAAGADLSAMTVAFGVSGRF
ncbi:omptin family outer membrane protease [Paracoccus caeni]|uniref:Omptin family outer membrane protease n=1 Tax=Paracoccus caeni TaxID=657651 RepID=A0A934SCB2_9RHOB|nr:omptin family outer membrane protease [Paracoccus caeni]MBK4216260.1 omptin family outer membrane protease [Paracoccus caeni]